MKKIYMILAMLLSLFGTTSQAQTILDEDFETSSTETYSRPVATGQGWTTVDSYNGNKMSYRWHNYYASKGTITGKHVAGCDAPLTASDVDGAGPREEILLTPELDLNDTYELSFTWIVSPMISKPESLYDLQVRVVTDGNLDDAETVFSIQNESMLKESGVLVYPITTWDPHTSKINLSDWKGQKVKLAFVYKMMTPFANVVWLDDVKVKQFTPAVTPVPVVSLDRFNFGTLYIGEKLYSDVITLTNQGTNGLKITGFDFPQGISCTLDPESVNLDKYESVRFQLAYSASLTSPASGNAVIHTNGGDVTIQFSATKQVVPEGYMLETFNDYFPPAGWKNNGWSGRKIAIEGDCSAYATGSFSDQILTSPRLDLTNGGKVTFTYYNQFDSYEGGTYQMNDIKVEVSTDGGQTWTQKWIFNYELGEYMETVTVDLGKGTDNSYVRWVNTAIQSTDEGAEEYSDFYLDRVLLPNVYGANGVPGAATLVKPADGATEVYPKDIVLEWGPAQFAQGYKVYVGSNAEMNNLVNGVDVNNALTYTIPVADYETTFSWKVVPYNTYGNAFADVVPVWSFTTQRDASTSTYPYSENFDSGNMPTGWTQTPDEKTPRNTASGYAEWEINKYATYGGSGATLYTAWLNAGGQNSVTTQEFLLPADMDMSISFSWGDAHPRELVIDESGMVKKQNVEPNNGVSDIVFEIFADGEWKQLSYISENSFNGDNKYWIDENISLNEYAGKKVQFRWTHHSYSSADTGAALDNILIDGVVGDKAIFNKDSWNAGKVNYNKAVNSGEIFSVLNKGKNVLKVKSATFGTQNFTTDLAAGTEIQPNDGAAFSMQFNAQTTEAVVEDNLTIEFEGGYSVSLPVKGEALAADVFYYSFEPNDLEYNWEDKFTMIDADNAPSYEFGAYWINFEKSGDKFAFWPGDDEAMYGIMSPVSGTHALVAASPNEASTKTADNWIISTKLDATSNSTFDFYARNWECLQSVLPSPAHRISVLVSETSNTDMNSFTAVLPEQEIPFLDGHDWQHYTVDLSAYAGKSIYVALRHTTNAATNVAFFDDFTFSHFQDANSIKAVSFGEIDNNAEVEVYSMSGMMVKKGYGVETLKALPQGMYVVKVNNGDAVKSFRITRK